MNGQEYEIKSWLIILCIFILMIGIGKCIEKNNSNKSKTFYQTDRTEIYYYDNNGNISKKETIWKDGRPDDIENFETQSPN